MVGGWVVCGGCVAGRVVVRGGVWVVVGGGWCGGGGGVVVARRKGGGGGEMPDTAEVRLPASARVPRATAAHQGCRPHLRKQGLRSSWGIELLASCLPTRHK